VEVVVVKGSGDSGDHEVATQGDLHEVIEALRDGDLVDDA